MKRNLIGLLSAVIFIVIASLPCAGERNPVDIILVLDMSGSMKSVVPGSETGLSKIELLKQAVEIFVKTWSIHAKDGDRMGVVYFDSLTSTMKRVSPFLKSVGDSAGEIAADVLSRTAGDCTSVGGALQVAYNNFDTAEPGKKRVIILCSDGGQTANPAVIEEGSPPRLKIQTISMNTPLPFEGHWCAAQPARAPDSSPIVPDDRFLFQKEIQIHTLGMGMVGEDSRKLLQRIAGETGAFHHFTTAPEQDLDIHFVNDLIAALKSGTPGILKVEQGKIGKDKSKSLSVDLSQGAKSLTLVLSWKGELKKDALSMEVKLADGSSVTPAKTEKGTFYTILNYNFPLTDKRDHRGEWWINIAAKTGVDSLRFQFSAIVDGPGFDYEVSIPGRVYGTGAKIPLSVVLSREGKPLTSSGSIWADVTAPAQALGNVLGDHFLKFKPKDPGKLKKNLFCEGSPCEFGRLLAAFADHPDNAALLKKKRVTRIALYDDGSADHDDAKAGDGIYSNVLSNTRVPGTYQFRFSITTPSSEGNVARTLSTSAFVGIKAFSAEGSVINVFALADDMYNIIVKPADKFGNLLGPGHSDDVRILSTYGTMEGKVQDAMNGNYSQMMNIEKGQSPLIVVLVKDEELYGFMLDELLEAPKK